MAFSNKTKSNTLVGGTSVPTSNFTGNVNRCFFHKEGECSGELILTPFCDLRQQTANNRYFPDSQSLLEAILLRADRFYLPKISLEHTYICNDHRKLFSQCHRSSTERKCSICVSCFNKSTAYRSISHLKNTSKLEAAILYEKFDKKNSYGSVICSGCRKDLKEIQNKENLISTESILYWLSNEYVSETSSYHNNDHDSEASFSTVTESVDDSELKREALNTFLRLCGNKRRVGVTSSFKNLSSQGKSNFLCNTRSIIRSILEFLVADEAEEVSDELFQKEKVEVSCIMDKHFLSVMGGIAEAYTNADDSSIRRSILSIVAPKISYELIQSFIPGLTWYRFTSARMFNASMGTGVIINQPGRIVQRFNLEQVDHFVDFIISGNICTDLPFGQQTIRLTDGTELYVSNTIRNMIPTRIVQQYYQYCKEMSGEFEPLGTSSLLKILHTCKASTRKSFQGVDYFVSDAGEAFDSMIKMIEDLGLASSESQRLISNLKRGRAYLKSDYKTHISKSSEIADHCATYALSDKSDKSFYVKCDHNHTTHCQECTILKSTLREIESLFSTVIQDKELSKRILARFKQVKEPIDAYKAHLLRTVNQDWCRDDIFESLGDDAFFVYCDWAMKWLPEKYREAQSDFFGKRGLSWHVSVVLKKGSSSQNDFEYKIFVHVFDNCTQDSTVVAAILKSILSKMKSKDEKLQRCYIRSDNAGCYHSSHTVLSIPQISKETKINIERLDFCDPQSGKGPCDRYAAVIKSNVRRYLNEKHNVTTASEFVKAAISNGGIGGVEVFETRINVLESKEKFQLSKITAFNNFEFSSTGLRVHRAYNIGPGKFFSMKDLKISKHIPDLICNAPTHSEHSMNFFSSDKAHESKTKADNSIISAANEDDDNERSNGVYECNEEGCVAKFLTFGKYLSHTMLGKHKRLPERHCLTDTVAVMFKSKLERIENRELVSLQLEVESATENTRTNPLPILLEGWAISSDRKIVRLTDKQTKYLNDKFDDGIRQKVRWKPETVSNDMYNLKVQGQFYFSSEEIMKPSQIRSYFSRIASKRKNLLIESIGEEANEQEILKDEQALDEKELREKVRNTCLSDDETVIDSPSMKRTASNQGLKEFKRVSFRSKNK